MTLPDPTPSLNFVGRGENAHVSRLLALGIRGPTRPVDNLVARATQPDRAAWTEQTVAAVGSAHGVPLRELLLTGRAPGIERREDSLRHLTRVKDACKKAAAKAQGESDASEPMLVYFLCLGAAMAHHTTLISSMPRSEIEGVLLDLACVLPDPWVDLLCRATLVELTGQR